MAAKTRKTKRKTTAKKKTAAPENKRFQDEILLLLTLAVSILLILSHLGLGGFVGGGISSFLFGVFGLPAYIIPILLFLGVAFLFSNKGNSFAYIKAAAAVAFTVMLCTLIQLLSVPYEKGQRIFSYFTYAAKQKRGGGLLGGIFVKLFCPAFGVAGAYVVVVMLMIISIILITEKSFLRLLKKAGAALFEGAKKDVAKFRGKAEARKQAEEEEISFGTTLQPEEEVPKRKKKRKLRRKFRLRNSRLIL